VDLTRPLVALALVAPSLLLAVPAHAACDVSVQNPYSPTNKTVAAGTVVTWCWTQSNHSVTADAGAFDSGVKNSGSTFQRTINATVAYHCTIHSSMHGTITVAAASPSPTKTTTPSPTPARTTPPPATHSPTPTRTPSRTPDPTPTSVSGSPTVTTPPPTTAPPTTVAPSTVEPTTVTPTPLAPLDPPQAKPKTGVAIAIGSLVAVGALGGAVWLFLRGRAAV
jgi:plastocyanin